MVESVRPGWSRTLAAGREHSFAFLPSCQCGLHSKEHLHGVLDTQNGVRTFVHQYGNTVLLAIVTRSFWLLAGILGLDDVLGGENAWESRRMKRTE